jgi:hypothetical protein
MSIWRQSMSYRICGKIWGIVLLLSVWRSPVFGGPLTTPPPTSSESGTRRFSEYEVDVLIEDLTMAAVEAIEQAAGEAARVAAMASLEREAAAVREARRLQGENRRLRQSKVKTSIITGVVCFLGGFAIGAGTTAILTGR